MQIKSPSSCVHIERELHRDSCGMIQTTYLLESFYDKYRPPTLIPQDLITYGCTYVGGTAKWKNHSDYLRTRSNTSQISLATRRRLGPTRPDDSRSASPSSVLSVLQREAWTSQAEPSKAAQAVGGRWQSRHTIVRWTCPGSGLVASESGRAPASDATRPHANTPRGRAPACPRPGHGIKSYAPLHPHPYLTPSPLRGASTTS